jgi:non-ribosomal peptide synthase protein (TIGR01720 family)
MGAEVLPPLPLDLPQGGANDLGSQRTATAVLDEETTRALMQEVPPVYRTEINDILLTALTQSFARWTGQRRLRVDLEGHGREDLFAGFDLSRTVGWFTTIFPVVLDLGEAGGDTGGEILQIKESLRAVPGRGIGFGLLRYLGGAEAAARLRSLPRAEVGFNYLGQLGQSAPEGERGPVMSPHTPRFHLLEVDCRIAGGQLRIGLSYSANLHARSTMERLAEDYLDALRAVVDHCRSPEAGGSSLSDFPLARLGEGDLERLLREMER